MLVGVVGVQDLVVLEELEVSEHVFQQFLCPFGRHPLHTVIISNFDH